MNRFMFAIENFMRNVGAGYRAIINRNQDRIKNAVIFDYNIEKTSKKYSGKRTTHYDRKAQNEFYERIGYRRK